MNAPRTLLIPTDFSPPAERAADYAVRLAEGIGARVVLYHAFAFPYDWYYWDEPELDGLRRDVEEVASKKLRAAADRVNRADVELVPRLDVQSDVAHGVLEAAEAEHADLIVMGTTGWTGERPQLGTVAGQVAVRSGRPVLMVHRDSAARSEGPRVLVPIDFTPPAPRALRMGIALARALGGHVEVLHVLPELPFEAEALGGEPTGDDEPPSREQRLRAIQAFIEDHAGGHPPSIIHLAEGDVVQEVARFASREQADLVVIGLSERDRTHKAERLPLEVHCPVLAVPAASSGDGEAGPAAPAMREVHR